MSTKPPTTYKSTRPLDEYIPTKNDRLAKAKFWSSVRGNPILDPEAMSNYTIASYAGAPGVSAKLASASFRSWFFNQTKEKQLLAAAAEPAIERLIEIIKPESGASPATQVAAAKLILEKAGYGNAPTKTEVSKVDSMSEAELEKYIKSLGLESKDAPN